MLAGVRDRVRRMPAVARLLALAALLLIAAAAHVGVRSGVTACGPGTSGPPCGADVAWVPLLVAGVGLAVVTAATAHLWPLPATWLVVTVLAASTGPAASGAYVVWALVGGAVAFATAVAVDLVPRRRARRDADAGGHDRRPAGRP